MSMVRGFAASAVVALAAVEPIVGDVDLYKYAITQGGLLAVVLVLLWSYRRDFKRIVDDQQARLGVMTELVQCSATALT